MKINKLVLILFVAFIGCNNEDHNFPMDKRFWSINDYRNAVTELRSGYKEDEELPNFNNLETRAIVEKFTDTENFNVVLQDNELGIKHKNEVAGDFFMVWKDMINIYNILDKKDKYTYELEYLETYKFGLELQLSYFKLGNEEILKSADDPDSESTKRVLDSNISTLISNYTNYLDLVNSENAFSENGKKVYAESISEYFSKLINNHPDFDYSDLKSKNTLLMSKSNSEIIKNSLKEINILIDSKKSY
ncbi:hypothetical protein FLGE108171_10955 [Flavobacterium gelidilacus]|uniref:hypothetical protein n=1 Tax=Flavobacterium gelidilacus TaxID=206041 RepID=UPI00042A0EA3|nr:hypothetical protein [Flavobacterium gelidilacus]